MIRLHSVFWDHPDPSWHVPLAPTPFHILLIVTTGRLAYRIQDGVHSLEKGDLLYIPAGTVREGISDKVQSHQKLSAHFTLAGGEAPELPMLADGRPELLRISSFEYVKQRFFDLHRQWNSHLPYKLTISEAILMELLGTANRDADRQRHSTIKSKLAADIQQYIDKHYRETIRIEELARLVGRTPNHVTTIFREVTGMTPIQYVHRVKIAKAEDMFINTNKSVGEIAEELGFCDPSHLYRVYKKLTGTTPSSAAKPHNIS